MELHELYLGKPPGTTRKSKPETDYYLQSGEEERPLRIRDELILLMDPPV